MRGMRHFVVHPDFAAGRGAVSTLPGVRMSG
jgi:hypothetical protein